MIGVVPARANSKRIPGKNVRPFAGKPLVIHTLEAAADSGVLDRIVCSTDSTEVATLLEEMREIEVQERPPSLAGDHATAVDVTLHAVSQFPRDAAVVQLLPTSPLRTADHIRRAADTFWREPERSLLSVGRPAGYEPWWAVALSDEQDGLEWLHATALESRSQDLPRVAFLSGAIAIARVGDLRRTRSFHSLDPRPFVMPFAAAVDIDTKTDWELAEALAAPR